MAPRLVLNRTCRSGPGLRATHGENADSVTDLLHREGRRGFRHEQAPDHLIGCLARKPIVGRFVDFQMVGLGEAWIRHTKREGSCERRREDLSQGPGGWAALR